MHKLSILLTAHKEKALLIPTFKSIVRAIKKIEENNIQSKILIILDSSDLQTLKIAKKLHSKNQKISEIHEVNFGCPALSRNYGIDLIQSEYLAIQDGDDLVSENWYLNAIEIIKNEKNKNLIIHPEWNVTFESEKIIMKHPCMVTDKKLYLGNMIYENYWTALSISRSENYKKIKYRSNKIIIAMVMRIGIGICVALKMNFYMQLLQEHFTLYVEKKKV